MALLTSREYLTAQADLAQAVRRAHPALAVRTVVADLADHDATVALGQRLAAEHPETTLLVNNAGTTVGGELEELSLAEVHRVLEVALRAVVSLTHGLLPVLLAHLRVKRPGRGRPRTTPDAVLGDKAYSARAHRAVLRSRGIKTVIPEPSDQVRNRRRRGARGGRPPAFDADTYRGRNVIERSFNTVKQWRGLATRYDKLSIVYRGAAVLRAITIWLKHL